MRCNFPAVRTGLSCSWKQLFAVGSTTEVKYKSFEKQSSCRAPTVAQLSDRYWNGWVWLQQFSAWRNWVLLLSRDNVKKYDWYCQLSGSRSNSMNSWKLPGHFSYGLGTRLAMWFVYPKSRLHTDSAHMINLASCVTKPFSNSWRGWGRRLGYVRKRWVL